MVELDGFPQVAGLGSKGEDGAESETEMDTSKMVQEANRKKKKSGGFQSMGLSHEVWTGVMKKGYKVPTPIQRKTVPLIMDGKDVVAMARTGSGKTAAFLLPLFEKLKARSAKAGARALVLSPTRELALQTLRFAKDLGRFTGLKYSCVLGGDAMEKQFAAIHSNPDVLFATPGRFVHLCLEMGLRLNSVEYVVFDEADRLFEMGLGEQLREILGRLPDTRQTVMFSATLPKLLVDFAKAGLTDPTLIRLDVESKVPDTLKLALLQVRADAKDAVLLHLLTTVIPRDQQTIVFAATRYHVEYLQVLLQLANIPNTYIYSQLDPAARKINAAKFAGRKVGVMVVTDLAARGLDIPMLDNVINYNFPAKSKLFIHRVGRVARAGRTGTAFSLVAQDEMAYLVDLQLFLGGEPGVCRQGEGDDAWHRKLGRVPQNVLDQHSDNLNTWYNDNVDLIHTKGQSANAYKQYLKSRSAASKESVKRCKDLKETEIAPHPLFKEEKGQTEEVRNDFLQQMKNFKPRSTIFEIGNTSKNKEKIDVMNNKRMKHASVIEANVIKLAANVGRKKNDMEVRKNIDKVEKSSEAEISETFDTIVKESKSRIGSAAKDKSLRHLKDQSNFIPYQAADQHTEAGYSMMTGFSAQASGAVLDLTGDEDGQMRRQKGAVVWDKKSKKYIKVQDDKKRIKTESGVYIAATYKTNRYAKWKERNKQEHQTGGDDDQGQDDGDGGNERGVKRKNGMSANHPAMKKAKNAVPAHKKGPKFEIKRPEQIMKKRVQDEKKAARKAKGGKKGKGRKGR